MKYQLLSHQGNVLFAHGNHLIPFYPVVPHLEKLLQQYKTVSFQPHITISSFNPAGELYAPERLPYGSLEDSGNETTPDFFSTDRHQTSINSPDDDTSSPLIFDNSQQPPTTLNDQANTIQTDTITPTAPPLGATSYQTSVYSQFRTTRYLRRQPVKDYSTHIPPSKYYFHSG